MSFNDGDADINQVISYRPDVILLDWIMPKKNGHDVLRELYNYSHDILEKVIVISGHIPDKEFDDWEDKVFTRLDKPLSISELNRAIF
jgi:DNA-binding NarL/FixJ family response regulator